MPRYARRSARVVLLNADDHVLLLRTTLRAGQPDGSHAWFTPGGGVERGESLPDAAARELAEEIGLRVAATELRPLAYTTGRADLGWARGLFRDDFFLHRVAGHEVDTSRQTSFESGHHAGHLWWSATELAATSEIVFPHGLAALVADVLAGRLPAAPVELPWHHEPPPHRPWIWKLFGR